MSTTPKSPATPYRALLSSLAASAFVVACALRATAPPPTPNLPDAQRSSASAALVKVDAPQEKICSHHGGLKQFCVKGFQRAFNDGLQTVLSRFFIPPSSAPPTYLAAFTLVEFSHSPTSAESLNGSASVQVAMRWKFTLTHASGMHVVDLTETTIGPQQLIAVSAGENAVAALDNAVLERIARAISEALAHPASAEQPPPSPSLGKISCTPGATQECIGAGACRGGQFCLADGSGYSVCDCGATAGDAGAK